MILKSILLVIILIISTFCILQLLNQQQTTEDNDIMSPISELPKVQMDWTKPADLNEGLPKSIEVFVSNSSYTPGIPLFCAYALIDLSDPKLEFKVVYGEGAKRTLTPKQYSEREKSKVYNVINGGFFNMKTGMSQGLLIHDQKLISIITTNQGTYKPTIGAFGMYENKTLETMWTYNIKDKDRTTYAYPKPAPNDKSKPPLPEPNATYPANGKKWEVKEAIGAGPTLLKDGQYYNGKQELFTDYILNERHPRSAICKTKDNKLILFAADGRLKTSKGLFLNETAGILDSLNCVDAMNLDGGGSTCLLSNGKEANHPSGGRERSVANAVLVMEKEG